MRSMGSRPLLAAMPSTSCWAMSRIRGSHVAFLLGLNARLTFQRGVLGRIAGQQRADRRHAAQHCSQSGRQAEGGLNGLNTAGYR
jgi:hypothetical protein